MCRRSEDDADGPGGLAPLRGGATPRPGNGHAILPCPRTRTKNHGGQRTTTRLRSRGSVHASCRGDRPASVVLRRLTGGAGHEARRQADAGGQGRPCSGATPCPSAAMLKPFERAQHRAGRHGRAHLRHRLRPAGPVDVLRGHRARRPHEDHRQRRRVHGRSSTSRTSRPRAPSPSRPPIRRSSGSAPARPTTATARAGATASIARPTAARPGPPRASAAPGPSRASWCTPPIRQSRGSRRWATSGATAPSAGSTRRPTPARRGSRCCRRRLPTTSRRAAARSPSTRRIPTRSTPCSTRAGARRGRSTRAPTRPKGRDVGGIFRSTDGGATWKKLAGGLPAQTGRIGLSRLREEPEDRLRGRPEQRGRHAEHRRGRQQARRRVPLRRRRRDLDADEPAQPAAVLLQPDPRGSRRTTSASTCSASCCTSRRTAGRPSARTASRRCTPTATRSPSTRATRSGCCSAPTAASTRAYDGGHDLGRT